MSSTELQRSLELEKKVICSSVAVLAHFIPKGPTAPRLHHDMTMSLLSRHHYIFSDAFENEEPEAHTIREDAYSDSTAPWPRWAFRVRLPSCYPLL